MVFVTNFRCYLIIWHSMHATEGQMTSNLSYTCHVFFWPHISKNVSINSIKGRKSSFLAKTLSGRAQTTWNISFTWDFSFKNNIFSLFLWKHFSADVKKGKKNKTWNSLQKVNVSATGLFNKPQLNWYVLMI